MTNSPTPSFDIERFWQDVLKQNRAALTDYFAPDAVVNWHCTNERFTAAEFIEANCAYPGAWTGEIERVFHAGDELVTATHVRSVDGALSFHATSFLRIVNGKIASLDEYWGDDGPPPAMAAGASHRARNPIARCKSRKLIPRRLQAARNMLKYSMCSNHLERTFPHGQT